MKPMTNFINLYMAKLLIVLWLEINRIMDIFCPLFNYDRDRFYSESPFFSWYYFFNLFISLICSSPIAYKI